MVDDGRAVGAAHGAEIADRERAAAELVGGELGRAGPLGHGGQGLGQLGDGQPIGVAHHGTTRPRGVSTATPRFTYSL